MTDLLETPAGDFEWGPKRRRDKLRPSNLRNYVSKTTLHDNWYVLAIGVGAAILAIGGALLWSTYRVSAAPVSSVETTQAVAVGDGKATTKEPPEATSIVKPDPVAIIHVSGLVAEPGIVEVPASSRVFQAIEAAGGSLADADLDAINLAAPVIDGSQLHVPAQPTPEASGTPDTTVTESADQPTAQITSDGSHITAETDAQITSEDAVEPAPESVQIAPETAAETTPATPTQPSVEAAPVTPIESAAGSLTETPPTAPTPAWQPAEPSPIPPEIEALLYDRETAPTPEEILALFEAAGVTIPPELEAAFNDTETATIDG